MMLNKACRKPSNNGAGGRKNCAGMANTYFNEDRSLLPSGWKKSGVINLTLGLSG